MSEVTLTAVVVREKTRELTFKPNGPAILEALRNAPRSTDPNIWRESREELTRIRAEWDED